MKMLTTWQNLSESNFENNLNNEIKQLQDEEWLPIYLPSQNSCFCIIKEVKEIKPFFSVFGFQASRTSEEIMSTQNDLIQKLPELYYDLPNSKIIYSKRFSEIINSLKTSNLDITSAHTNKKGVSSKEAREVNDPRLILDWILPTLAANFSSNRAFSVIKKIRDAVEWSDAYIPFRRSALYFSMKTLLHLKLIKTFGNERGTLYYKSIILFVMSCLCDDYTKLTNQNNDLLHQIMVKISRRAAKLECYIDTKFKMPSNTFSQEYNEIKEILSLSFTVVKSGDIKITYFLNQIHQNSRSNEVNLTELNFDIDHPTMKDSIQSILEYSNNYKESIQTALAKTIKAPKCPQRTKLEHSIADLSYLNTGIDNGLSLINFENWVIENYDAFKNQSTQYWFDALEKYSEIAPIYYKDDPIGKSRMILICFTIIVYLDKIAVEEFPFYLHHKLGIDCSLFKFLLLPNKSELKFLSKLSEYIKERQKAKYDSLITDIKSHNSVAVHYSAKYAEIRQAIRKIDSKTLVDIENKKEEFYEMKKKYNALMKISRNPCEYTPSGKHRKKNNCEPCYSKRQADQMSIRILEKPLPEDNDERISVVFNLMMPNIFAYVRDSFYLLYSKILKIPRMKASQSWGLWNSLDDLRPYDTNISKYVFLGSTTKSFGKTHYSIIDFEQIIDAVIKPNGLDLNLSDNSYIIHFKNIYNIELFFTLPSNSIYENLQWTLNSTNHNENQVIAKQSECTKGLDLREYLNFGFFRAGNRLQIKNMLYTLVQKALSLNTPEVNMLIIQSLCQVGPESNDSGSLNLIEKFENHLDISNIELMNDFYIVMKENLASLKLNWDNHLSLLLIVNISKRFLSLSEESETKLNMKDLLIECREISTLWQERIEDTISKIKSNVNQATKLRFKLVEISFIFLLTFYVDQSDYGLVINSSDIHGWLTSNYFIQKYLNMKIKIDTSKLKKFPLIEYLRREVQSCSINLENHFHKLIKKCSSNQLTSFLKSIWPDSINGEIGSWTRYPYPSDLYYYSIFVRKDGKVKLTLQISLSGIFLIDGRPNGSLPAEIICHKDYMRIFGDMMFNEVAQSCENENSFITSKTYYDHIFKFVSCNNFVFIIKRNKENKEYLYVPFDLLEIDLPTNLVHNFSHWLDLTSMFLFFEEIIFIGSTPPSYIADIRNNTLKECVNNRNLLSIHSLLFKELYAKVFYRLEKKCYINIYKDSEIKISIYLPRLNLNFYLSKDEGILNSYDFENMIVSQNQKLHTLLGLEEGLVIEDKKNKEFSLGSKSYLVPNSEIGVHYVCENSKNVYINLEEFNNPPFYKYEIDEILNCLKAGDSRASWLYLAYLHSLTSYSFNDEFLKMKGFEMSIYILQSSHIWSNGSYSEEEINLLIHMADLTPKRIYYPKHLKKMQTTKINKFTSSMTGLDAYYLIINQLLKESESINDNIINEDKHEKKASLELAKINDLFLVTKSYLRNSNYYSSCGKMNIYFSKKQYSEKNYSLVSSNKYHENKNNFIRYLSFLFYNDSKFYSIERLEINFNYKEKLVGSIENLELSKFSNWIEILDNDLCDYFINIYLFLLKSENSFEDKINKFLMLSFLSNECYMNEKNLLLLKALWVVFTYKNNFRLISPPNISNYTDTQENDLDLEKIDKIIDKNIDSFPKYDYTYINLTAKQEEDLELRRAQYDERKFILKTEILNRTQRAWDSKSFNSLKDYSFDDEVNKVLNVRSKPLLENIIGHLTHWNNNLQLKYFCDKINEKLSEIVKNDSDVEKIIPNSIKNDDDFIINKLEEDKRKEMNQLIMKKIDETPFLCDAKYFELFKNGYDEENEIDNLIIEKKIKALI